MNGTGMLDTMTTKTDQSKRSAAGEARKTALAVRAWHAYNALPRDEFGELPSMASLEREKKLANGLLGKIFHAQRGSAIPSRTMRAVAAALHTTVEWLEEGIGNAPILTRDLPPRPGTKVAETSDRYPNRARAINAIGQYVDPKAVADLMAHKLRTPTRPDADVVDWMRMLLQLDENVRRGI